MMFDDLSSDTDSESDSSVTDLEEWIKISHQILTKDDESSDQKEKIFERNVDGYLKTHQKQDINNEIQPSNAQHSKSNHLHHKHQKCLQGSKKSSKENGDCAMIM
jgi:site-specific recombinase XerC